MPFDLGSAKPVEESASGGFDLGSAKPVEENTANITGTESERTLRNLKPTPTERKLGPKASAVLGLAEGAVSTVTGLGASVAGGLAGIGKTGVELVKGKSAQEAASSAADTVQDVQRSLTYKPRTASGEAALALANLPMDLAKKLTGKIGAATGKPFGAEVGGEAIGEVVPDIAGTLLGGASALKSRRTVGERRAPVAGQDYSPLRKMTKEQEDRYFRMKEQNIEPTLGNVTRDPAQVRYEQQTAQLPEGGKLAQRAREQDAALTESVERIKKGENLKGATGLNEIETGRTVRTALESKAAAGLKEVNDKYAKARASGETKELVDLGPIIEYLDSRKAEAISTPELNSMRAMVDELASVSAPPAAPKPAKPSVKPESVAKISDRMSDARTKVKWEDENLGHAETAVDNAIRMADNARQLAEIAKDRHQRLLSEFNKPDSKITGHAVDAAELRAKMAADRAKAAADRVKAAEAKLGMREDKFQRSVDDLEGLNQKHKTLSSELNAQRNQPEPVKPGPTATIDDIENLRQRVGELSLRDGSVKKHANEIRKIIDGITEGKGGELYKDARKARKQWGDEFEERLGVANLLEKKTRTDYKTAVEDVWNKAVVGGSIHELGSVIESLRTSKGEQAKASAQALKEMQSRTVDYIVEKSTESGTFSPDKFKKAVRSIGVDKLDLLLGRDAINALAKTAENARDVKTAPIRTPGSDTYLNVRTMAQRLASDHADHLIKGIMPRFAGRILDSVRAGAAERKAKLQAEQAVEEALHPRRAGMEDIRRLAEEEKKKNRSAAMREAATTAAKLTPATMGSTDSKD